MELIAILVAFILGAYIRQPFTILFTKAKKETEVKVDQKPKTRKKTADEIYNEAYFNATHYDGTEQEEIKETTDE